MRFDILDLKEFYAGKLGSLRLNYYRAAFKSWPSLKDQRLCTMVMACPILNVIGLGTMETAFMPATMGVVPVA